MLDSDFVAAFKCASEERWRESSIKGTIWGFQFQARTRWNPGLADEMIAQYETEVDARFPPDFKTLLRCMNGTDIPTIDVRGSSGEAPRFAPGFYSYPRDLGIIKQLIERVSTERGQLAATLEEQGFHLPEDAKLIPIFGHRYIVCSPRLDNSTVLSIWDPSDAIIYGSSLKEYLEREVLS
jgi:hypothetical protein